MFIGQRPQKYPDMQKDKIHVMSADQIEGLRAAAKIAAGTLKHAVDNTKVILFVGNVYRLA